MYNLNVFSEKNLYLFNSLFKSYVNNPTKLLLDLYLAKRYFSKIVLSVLMNDRSLLNAFGRKHLFGTKCVQYVRF